jgi:hypothetical protein
MQNPRKTMPALVQRRGLKTKRLLRRRVRQGTPKQSALENEHSRPRRTLRKTRRPLKGRHGRRVPQSTPKQNALGKEHSR